MKASNVCACIIKTYVISDTLTINVMSQVTSYELMTESFASAHMFARYMYMLSANCMYVIQF